MKRRMKKVMAAMLVTAMTASLALTGCGGSKKSASKDGKKELTVWEWNGSDLQKAFYFPRNRKWYRRYHSD